MPADTSTGTFYAGFAPWIRVTVRDLQVTDVSVDWVDSFSNLFDDSDDRPNTEIPSEGYDVDAARVACEYLDHRGRQAAVSAVLNGVPPGLHGPGPRAVRRCGGGEYAAQVAASLVRLSVEFTLDPLPDDRYEFSVKADQEQQLLTAIGTDSEGVL
jgi:hypothetical protein